MSSIQHYIEDMEAQAAVSWQVAKLTIDPERRAYNTRLCDELRLLAKQLRSSAHGRTTTSKRSSLAL